MDFSDLSPEAIVGRKTLALFEIRAGERKAAFEVLDALETVFPADPEVQDLLLQALDLGVEVGGDAGGSNDPSDSFKERMLRKARVLETLARLADIPRESAARYCQQAEALQAAGAEGARVADAYDRALDADPGCRKALLAQLEGAWDPADSVEGNVRNDDGPNG